MRNYYSRIFLAGLLSAFLTACFDETVTYAPVTEISTVQPIPRSGVHQVRAGETLYEIAWMYGMDYQVLAKHNHISSPYLIKVGDNIYLRTFSNTPSPKMPSITTLTQESIHLNWIKPTHGKVIQHYARGEKGIDYTGSRGQDVVAAAPGKVVYAGTGIRGYGKLILIKHNDLYVSAYAHNEEILVQEG